MAQEQKQPRKSQQEEEPTDAPSTGGCRLPTQGTAR